LLAPMPLSDLVCSNLSMPPPPVLLIVLVPGLALPSLVISGLQQRVVAELLLSLALAAQQMQVKDAVCVLTQDKGLLGKTRNTFKSKENMFYQFQLRARARGTMAGSRVVGIQCLQA
jgi:hypothetical protein